MWFDGGVYRFGANLHDKALVKIDGAKVWTSSSGAVSCSGQIRPTRGWHAVEFRFNNGNDANAGPRSTDKTWTLEKGFGVNLGDPELPSAYGHRYTTLVDDGTGNLFRHAAVVGSAAATADQDAVASHTLAFAAGEGGSVTSAGGACDADKTISVTATPNDGYRFVKWTGDVAYGQTFAATVDVPGNRDRSLTAVFEPDVDRAEKTFVGATNGKWSDDANWEPEGVPGPTDDVVIPASKNVAPDVTVTVIGGWHGGITTTSVAHWREYNGEVLVGGLLTVGGRLTLAGEGLSGSPVRVKAGKVKVLDGGRLDSDAGGWFWTTFHDGMPGCRAPGSRNINGNNYSGGAYGGGGGGHSSTTAHTTTTYGEAMRPYMPGSAGGNNGGNNRGGGALRLEVDGRLVNDGRISADGSFGNGGSAGGGSGGSLWVTCQSVRMATNATIRVLGGNQSNSSTGAGGGGRLLVATRLSPEAIDALYETGALPSRLKATVYDGQPDFVPGTLSAAGGVNSAWDAKNGIDGTVRWIEGPKHGMLLIVR